ncbi:trimethylamine N-oxide reductase system protein TorE [Shewanella abyssi]|uniref:trimethylamine N-oxide reductase system protein TorE n=1 Tax=Shewanella abyssi TaxID=311789 RepID=UPI00200F96AB|nr:trimethylamine N-oxide reductase system protein TorE [Shewanella abyssi]MCL1051502.1 trimethylamine N-oxide reductase system protein TorE [Shewanella abyssi]
MTNQNPPNEQKSHKKDELKAVSFIIFILFPALSIAFVSTYGFIIWMIQAFGGVVAH